MDPWYLENLVCPVDRTPLRHVKEQLVSASGRAYPVVDGIPVMLIPEAEQTHWVASASLEHAKKEMPEGQFSRYFLETLGISDEERVGIAELLRKNDLPIDPVVAFVIAQTNGIAYKHLVGKINAYPIPELRLPNGNGEVFLDIGCNWGRWCIAAARKGYSAIGIDPSLGAIITARRVAEQLKLPNRYIVADARNLPFNDETINVIFSYSVLQHFAKANVKKSLSDIGRVLRPGGISFIQMPNVLGIRSLYHQMKRKFRDGKDFEVRYWSLKELQRAFTKEIGQTKITVDCFLGLGLQPSDADLMSRKVQFIIRASEVLRSISEKIEGMKCFADSVYVLSKKNGLEKQMA